eukprot:Skav230104  [mRNA]  locus=scaffold283:141179:146598:- [translate_table: standard]
MRYTERIFVLLYLLKSATASHASSHALLAADSPERHREYVVDEHGKSSPSSGMMRREAFEPKSPRRYMPRRTRFKSLLQKQQELNGADSDLSRSCSQLYSVLRVFSGEFAEKRGGWQGHYEVGEPGAGRSLVAGTMAAESFEPACTTVDLGEERKIGEVWISGQSCNDGDCEVGLRDEPCAVPVIRKVVDNATSDNASESVDQNASTKETEEGEEGGGEEQKEEEVEEEEEAGSLYNC